MNQLESTRAVFGVVACQEARVLLRSWSPGGFGSRGIVIGGWNNSRSFILSNDFEGEEAFADTPNIVDCFVRKYFWVRTNRPQY